jgi:protein TonB
VAASLALQTILVGLAFLAPLMHVAVLQKPRTVPLWMPPEPLKQAVERASKHLVHSAPGARPVFVMPRLETPTAIPKSISSTPDPPEFRNAFSGASPVSAPFSSLGGTNIESVPPVSTPPVVKPGPVSVPVRVTAGVQSARLVFGPKPVYPPLALTTHTQGTVRIQAIIGRDGAIKNLQVLSGPPLLIPVAMAAVKQWRYQPTLLNGDPVEVITEVDVNFTLEK